MRLTLFVGNFIARKDQFFDKLQVEETSNLPDFFQINSLKLKLKLN